MAGIFRLLAALCVPIVTAGPAAADTVFDFYRGKTVTSAKR